MPSPQSNSRLSHGPLRKGLFLLVAICVANQCLALHLAAQESPAESRPNIILIYADDLGWTDLGCYGSEFYETPHLDALARDGIRFTQAYANAPNCAPSRACLMTGMYTPRHGIYTVGTPERGKTEKRKLVPTPNTTELPTQFHTVADLLSQAGYETCHLGKWHLGNQGDYAPQRRGFQLSLGHDISIGRIGHFTPYHSKSLSDGPSGEYLADRLTDEAINFIKGERDRPFFLYLAHHAVHTPIRAKEPLIEHFQQKQPAEQHQHPVYAAMIASLDESVGRIVAAVDEFGIAEQTLVIFFSDNGGHGKFTSNAPLRGSKGMLYEGGIRVPLIARWQGTVPLGKQSSLPVIGVDFLPTFVELSHAEVTSNQPQDGVSLASHLRTPNSPLPEERSLHWHFPAYLEPYTRKQGPWRTTPASAIRVGRWKLIELFETGRLELYDLQNDLSETTNLVETEPQIAHRLHKAMQAWRAEVDAPVPTELNEDFEP